jgi:TolA-binding protein
VGPTTAGAPADATAEARATEAVPATLLTAQAKIDAKLYDQALDDLKRTVANSRSSTAAAAQLLIGDIHERQGRLEDAQAAFVELRTRFGSSPAAADATFRLAELTLRSKRPDRDAVARGLYGEVGEKYPRSPQAPLALSKKAALESRAKLRTIDDELHTSVPAALVTYRTLVRAYPTAPPAEAAYETLAEQYKDIKQYLLAAQTLDEMARRFPQNKRDAAWRAAELYEDKVKDDSKAKAGYALVPQTSSHYADAQKKLK